MTASIGTEAGYIRKSHKESPLGLFIAVIRDNPKWDEHQCRDGFKELILHDDYRDFLLAVITEWTSIKFSTAQRAAKPPTVQDMRVKAKKKREAQSRTETMVKKARDLIGSRLLNLVMPNGKPLSMCTGAECKTFGGLFTSIGNHVGDDRLVGDVLTAKQLSKMGGSVDLHA